MGSFTEDRKKIDSPQVHFNIADVLRVDRQINQKYAVLILNRPICHTDKFLIPLWNKASVRLTVDGGTNRWLQYIDKLNLPKSDILPIDMVTGDMDSITDTTMKRIKEANTKIIYTPDQDETDFSKSLIELFKYCNANTIKLDMVCAIYQSSGRIDHTMSNINTLYKFSKCCPPIFLISDDSISWLLPPGKTTIAVPEPLNNSSNAWCSLIPFRGKCQAVTTCGLKWNLNNTAMEFGDLISTSNTFTGTDIVSIASETQLFWSMGLIPVFSKWYDALDIEN